MAEWIKNIAPYLYTYRAKFFAACSATFQMFYKAGLIAFAIDRMFSFIR